MPVFDPEVFSFMFDITDVPPVLQKVAVPEKLRVNASGQNIPITIYIVNNSSTPGREFLMNLTVDPTITLYGPLDTIILTATAMENVEQGVYTYTYDTTGLSIGVYSAVFNAVNGTHEMVSKKHVVFTIR